MLLATMTSRIDIWMLLDGDCPTGYDQNVTAPAIRGGNYDHVTNSVVWATTDTDHMLLNSLYLSRPSLTREWKCLALGRPDRIAAGCHWLWRQVQWIAGQARYDAGTPFTQP
jgi:hypothetical protein